MSIYRQLAFRHTLAPLARVLACILLIGIVYSSTFAFVHSHGSVSSELGTSISADLAGHAGVLSTIPLSGRSSANDCLICVLHRQFSNSTVHTPFFVAGPSAKIAFFSAPVGFYYSGLATSRPIARLSGRAPPLH